MISDVVSANRIVTNNTAGTEQNLPVVGSNGSTLTLANLKAGDSIQAKVISKDGENVRLQVDGNKYIDARMASGINVEAGKSIVFEVRSTNSGITLSPLFTNVSSDPNISRALSMAGLPLNSDTVTMTKSMMQAGMGIDRNSLINMFRDIAAYPNSDVTDIVDLHRLGLEVNDVNVEQIENYKNLSYQLGEGMQDVANNLTELVDNLVASKGELSTDENVNLLNAGKVFESIIDIASELKIDEATLKATHNPEGDTNEKSAEIIADNALSAADRALKLLGVLNSNNDNALSKIDTGDGIENNITNAGLSGDNVDALKKEILKLAEGLKNEGNIDENLNADLKALSHASDTNELLSFLKNTVSKAIDIGDTDSLRGILNNNIIKDTIFSAVRFQWSITPEDVADKNNVKELYNRLQRQLGLINEAVEGAGLKDSSAGNAVTNMSNNLDFLNQVNQMYAYIQLPLKLSTGADAHGDLYVYSNGKKISSKDGKVSALLHLDMEHLGPLDVYVAMDTSGLEKKVSTQFSVSDEGVLLFLSEHMDELTKRLEAKGYSCSARLSVKGSESDGEDTSKGSEGGIRDVVSMTGNLKLSEYSFDVRT